jgi:uroporphyrinogen decarboxylase
MNAKERFITTLGQGRADRLPVTTHHVMPSFLDSHMNGISNDEFFDEIGLDPIKWVMAYQYSPERGEYFDPGHTELGFLEARRVCSDNWRVIIEPMDSASYTTWRFNIATPERTLSMVLQSNEHTTWLAEPLVKEKADIEVIAKYMTVPLCNTEEINSGI